MFSLDVRALHLMMPPLIVAMVGCSAFNGSDVTRDGSAIEKAIIITPPPPTVDAREWIDIKKRYPDAKPLKDEPSRLEWRTTTSDLVYRNHIIDPRTFTTSEGRKTMYFDVTAAVTAQ